MTRGESRRKLNKGMRVYRDSIMCSKGLMFFFSPMKTSQIVSCIEYISASIPRGLSPSTQTVGLHCRRVTPLTYFQAMPKEKVCFPKNVSYVETVNIIRYCLTLK